MQIESQLKTIANDTRYPVDAFLFIQRGLDFTVTRLHGEYTPSEDDTLDNDDVSRHVSGQELCAGLRDFAIKEYGLLARTVLRRWSVTSCRDFGEMVFAMVDGGLMRKADSDSIHDFTDAFVFSDAFAPALMLSQKQE